MNSNANQLALNIAKMEHKKEMIQIKGKRMKVKYSLFVMTATNHTNHPPPRSSYCWSQAAFSQDPFFHHRHDGNNPHTGTLI